MIKFAAIFMIFEKKLATKLNTLQDVIKALKEGEYEEVLEQTEDLTFNISEFDNYAFWREKRYTRNCIARDEFFELVLLCWEPGQTTATHCHNEQECWVKVISGSFAEELYELNTETGKLEFIETSTLASDEVTRVEHATVFHNLSNISAGRSMSLHLYMRPIDTCKIYDEETKSLRQVDLSYDTYEGHKV